jgi:hypothetical protein
MQIAGGHKRRLQQGRSSLFHMHQSFPMCICPEACHVHLLNHVASGVLPETGSDSYHITTQACEMVPQGHTSKSTKRKNSSLRGSGECLDSTLQRRLLASAIAKKCLPVFSNEKCWTSEDTTLLRWVGPCLLAQQSFQTGQAGPR